MSGQYQILNQKGDQISLDDVITAAIQADVVCFGEQHDDSLTHLMQYKVLAELTNKANRPVVLSMEMFETDVQYIVDEYLSGFISEASFLADTRPWPNYKKDYKPMVEHMKEKKLAIVAGNPPRRYVRMVSKNGQAALSSLDKKAKALLPKLPFTVLTGKYKDKFDAIMGGHNEGMINIFASQNLWDASMANGINKALKNNKKSLVYHVCGKFHVEEGLGTIAQLKMLNKSAKVCNIIGITKKEFDSLDAKTRLSVGHFIVVTGE
jgi:uncharacterized iron-regulated protein